MSLNCEIDNLQNLGLGWRLILDILILWSLLHTFQDIHSSTSYLAKRSFGIRNRKHLRPDFEIGNLQHLGLSWRLRLDDLALRSFFRKFQDIHSFISYLEWRSFGTRKRKYLRLNYEIGNLQHLNLGWRLRLDGFTLRSLFRTFQDIHSYISYLV